MGGPAGAESCRKRLPFYTQTGGREKGEKICGKREQSQKRKGKKGNDKEERRSHRSKANLAPTTGERGGRVNY